MGFKGDITITFFPGKCQLAKFRERLGDADSNTFSLEYFSQNTFSLK